MSHSTVLKLLLVAITSLSLIACGGSSGSPDKESTKEQKNTKQEEITIEDKSSPKHVISTMVSQPELEKISDEITTTSQSSAAQLQLNAKYRFSQPKASESLWFKYRGDSDGYVVVKIEYDALVANTGSLDAFFDSTSRDIPSRDYRFKPMSKTILAVMPTYKQGWFNQFSLGSSISDDLTGTIIVTELNKETLGLKEHEFLVDMHAKNMTGNCIANEIEESRDEFGYSRISNYSLSYYHYLVINLNNLPYFQELGGYGRESIRHNGNKLDYSDAEKSTGYGWTKGSYTADGTITIDADKGTLIDESEGRGIYHLERNSTKFCDEQYYEEGIIILK